MAEDILKKIINPRYYIPNFLKIRTKDAELVPFKMNKAQDYVLSIIEEQKKKNKPIRLIVLKARQLGISTFSEGYIFNDESTNTLKNALIVAHEDAASQNLYQMYKTYYENLPPELTPMVKYSNSQEFLFENPTTNLDDKRRNPGLQSKIRVASARNVDAGRSTTIHNLHASEVAFWRDAKTLMTALMQCVPDKPNTCIILESTANGVGGYFYDMWLGAEKGENEFVPVFLPWFWDEEYKRDFETEEQKEDFISQVNLTTKDSNGNEIHTEEYETMRIAKEQYNIDLTYEQLNWRKWTIANKCNGDLEVFHQEYPSNPEEAFIASGRPRFSVSVLKQYRRQCVNGDRGYLEWVNKTPDNFAVRFIPDEKGYIEIWNKPEEGKYYCIGADVAEGLVDGDYSDGVVGDEDFNINASWYGHIDPDLFGEELVKLAVFYNNAYLGIENNNHGLTTLKAVTKLEYWNIFFTKSYDKISDTTSQKIGWSTTSKTKPLMIDKLAEFIREKYLGIKWRTLINECLTYIIEDNGSTNAQDGCHDDTVMGTAIMLQLLLEGKGENYVPERTDIEKKKIQRTSDTRPHINDDNDIDEDSVDKLEIAR